MSKHSKSTSPENRRKTGVSKLRGGHDPSIGKETQFLPGETGNPGGRPKSKPISEAYAALLEKKVPGDKKQRSYAELLAEGQLHAAIKGSTNAAREVADRVEGKAMQPIEVSGPDSAPLEFNLNIRFIDDQSKTDKK